MPPSTTETDDDAVSEQRPASYQWLTTTRTTSTGHRLLTYNGACHNIHGHNLHWDVSVRVNFADTDSSNMTVDLKTLATHIDAYDHALVLNEADPLLFVKDDLGDVITTDGDPTCERVAETLADTLLDELPIDRVKLDLAETDKYTISVERER